MLNLCSLPAHCLDYSDPAQHCWRPVVHGRIEDYTVQQHHFAHLVLMPFTVINIRFNSLPTSVVSTLGSTLCLPVSSQHCWRPVVHGRIEDFTVQQHCFAHLVLMFFTVINIRLNCLPTSVVSTLLENSSPWKDRRFYCATTSFCSLSADVLHCDQH